MNGVASIYRYMHFFFLQNKLNFHTHRQVSSNNQSSFTKDIQQISSVLNTKNKKSVCFVLHASLSIFFHILNLKQLTLDIHFLLEIAKWGGYLSDTIMNVYLDSESRIKSAFLSTGMDLER